MALTEKTKNILRGKNDLAVEMADSYRLLLATKARWLIVGLLAVHWIVSFSAFILAQDVGRNALTFSLMIKQSLDLAYYPTLIMFVVIAINAFLHIGWYKLPTLWQSRPRFFLHVQIVMDILIVLTLIHFTGGVTSWLWPLFLLINLELIYLFSSNIRIFTLGLMAGIGYSVLALLEYSRVLATYPMPFLPQTLQYNPTLVILILIWVNLIGGFTLALTLYLRRGEHQEIKEKIIRDTLTHLYKKNYFYDRLNSEIQRSTIFNRVFSLILIEIDDFDHYLKSNGRGQADELLRWVGEVLRMNVRRSENLPAYELDIAAHLEKAEFAILLPETGAEEKRDKRDIAPHAEIFASGAITLAEHIRTTIESSEFTYGEGVTISASIVSFPIDGPDEKELMAAAYKGLRVAQKSGKNKVMVANKQQETELSKN